MGDFGLRPDDVDEVPFCFVFTEAEVGAEDSPTSLDGEWCELMWW